VVDPLRKEGDEEMLSGPRPDATLPRLFLGNRGWLQAGQSRGRGYACWGTVASRSTPFSLCLSSGYTCASCGACDE